MGLSGIGTGALVGGIGVPTGRAGTLGPGMRVLRAVSTFDESEDVADEDAGATFLGCIRIRRILLTNISLRVVIEPASELKPPSFSMKNPLTHLIPRLSLSASSTL